MILDSPHVITHNMPRTYILVIGSTACLGRALALSILDLPSKPTVIVCGRRKERLDELIGAHGAQKIPVRCVGGSWFTGHFRLFITILKYVI